jgi:hypothetical protein
MIPIVLHASDGALPPARHGVGFILIGGTVRDSRDVRLQRP